MVIDTDVWKEVARLDMGGVRKFEEITDGYRKMQNYRGMRLDPTRNLRNRLGVGGLTAEDKMLVYPLLGLLASVPIFIVGFTSIKEFVSTGT